MRRLAAGDHGDPIRLSTILGVPIEIPATRTPWTHLQLRRFAGCPVCNLHVREVATRAAEILAAGVTEVVVFHSTVDEMLPFQGELPFAVVADPSRALYGRFGAESSVRSVLDPRAWCAVVRGSAANHPSSMLRGSGGHLGLPAEFLLSAEGRVFACKYGAHADDHWSVDELLSMVREAHGTARVALEKA